MSLPLIPLIATPPCEVKGGPLVDMVELSRCIVALYKTKRSKYPNDGKIDGLNKFAIKKKIDNQINCKCQQCFISYYYSSSLFNS